MLVESFVKFFFDIESLGQNVVLNKFGGMLGIITLFFLSVNNSFLFRVFLYLNFLVLMAHHPFKYL